MLFDPFEEQFDAPAQAVELRDGESGQDEIVGQKDQIFSALGILPGCCPNHKFSVH